MILHKLAIAAVLTTAPLAASAAVVEPLCLARSRACLVATAKTYLDALLSHDGSRIPLSPNVRRTENGLDNAKGAFEVRESFARTKMIRAIRDPRYVVDPERGEVTVYFLNDIALRDPETASTKAGSSTYKVAQSAPPGDYTMHEAERFHIEKGLIDQIEIIGHLEKGRDAKSGW